MDSSSILTSNMRSLSSSSPLPEQSLNEAHYESVQTHFQEINIVQEPPIDLISDTGFPQEPSNANAKSLQKTDARFAVETSVKSDVEGVKETTLAKQLVLQSDTNAENVEPEIEAIEVNNIEAEAVEVETNAEIEATEVEAVEGEVSVIEVAEENAAEIEAAEAENTAIDPADAEIAEVEVTEQVAAEAEAEVEVAEIADVEVTEPEAAEAEATEAEAAEVEVAEAADAEITELEAAEAEEAEAEVVEAEVAEQEIGEIEGAEVGATEVEAAEIKVPEVEAVEAELIETEAVEAEAAEVEVPETEIVEPEVREVEAAEVGAAESEVAELITTELEVADVLEAEVIPDEVVAVEEVPTEEETAQLLEVEATATELEAAETEAAQAKEIGVGAEIEATDVLETEVVPDEGVAVEEVPTEEETAQVLEVEATATKVEAAETEAAQAKEVGIEAENEATDVLETEVVPDEGVAVDEVPTEEETAQVLEVEVTATEVEAAETETSQGKEFGVEAGIEATDVLETEVVPDEVVEVEEVPTEEETAQVIEVEITATETEAAQAKAVDVEAEIEAADLLETEVVPNEVVTVGVDPVLEEVAQIPEVELTATEVGAAEAEPTVAEAVEVEVIENGAVEVEATDGFVSVGEKSLGGDAENSVIEGDAVAIQIPALIADEGKPNVARLTEILVNEVENSELEVIRSEGDVTEVIDIGISEVDVNTVESAAAERGGTETEIVVAGIPEPSQLDIAGVIPLGEITENILQSETSEPEMLLSIADAVAQAEGRENNFVENSVSLVIGKSLQSDIIADEKIIENNENERVEIENEIKTESTPTSTQNEQQNPVVAKSNALTSVNISINNNEVEHPDEEKVALNFSRTDTPQIGIDVTLESDIELTTTRILLENNNTADLETPEITNIDIQDIEDTKKIGDISKNEDKSNIKVLPQGKSLDELKLPTLATVENGNSVKTIGVNAKNFNPLDQVDVVIKDELLKNVPIENSFSNPVHDPIDDIIIAANPLTDFIAQLKVSMQVSETTDTPTRRSEKDSTQSKLITNKEKFNKNKPGSVKTKQNKFNRKSSSKKTFTHNQPVKVGKSLFQVNEELQQTNLGATLGKQLNRNAATAPKLGKSLGNSDDGVPLFTVFEKESFENEKSAEVSREASNFQVTQISDEAENPRSSPVTRSISPEDSPFQNILGMKAGNLLGKTKLPHNKIRPQNKLTGNVNGKFVPNHFNGKSFTGVNPFTFSLLDNIETTKSMFTPPPSSPIISRTKSVLPGPTQIQNLRTLQNFPSLGLGPNMRQFIFTHGNLNLQTNG